MTYPLSANEEQRLKALYGLQILDTLPEEGFDDLTVLASQIVGVPIATITLVDRDRQWFKSKIGLSTEQTSRSVSFCAHTVMGDSLFEVEDATKDERFANNALVTGAPNIRFYAGVPLKSPNGGENVGTLCTIDRVPRKLNDEQRRALEILGRQVMAQLELRRVLREREVRDGERGVLQKMSNLLHSCLTIEEARRVISRSIQRLFSEDSGAVYLASPQQPTMELLVHWGNAEENHGEFSRETCWALRRGRAHRASSDPGDLYCAHHSRREGRTSFCVPMVAQGEAIGLVTVIWKDAALSDSRSEWVHWLAATVADILAVALAGLRLREELRENSIRDPLTDLFNRRYMEETLARELHRVQRLRLPLGLLALDLDHFKQRNDTYGHDAGDATLRAFARLLQTTFRQDDIVCRSGGEEFLIILPTADTSIVLQRAEELRRSAEKMIASYGGKPLPLLTVSGGVAIFPQHGNTAAELIRAADVALYQAKERGRNRIVIAGSPLTATAAND